MERVCLYTHIDVLTYPDVWPITQYLCLPRQAFSDYQMQQLTSNFIDQFGLNDEEFGEPNSRIE